MLFRIRKFNAVVGNTIFFYFIDARINLDKGSLHYCGLLGSDTRFMLVGSDDGG